MKRTIIFLVLLSLFFIREAEAQSIVRSELLEGVVVSITDFVKEFDTNQLAAEAKYDGQNSTIDWFYF